MEHLRYLATHLDYPAKQAFRGGFALKSRPILLFLDAREMGRERKYHFVRVQNFNAENSTETLASQTTPDTQLAPVVQKPDNFIQWISHYPTDSICAKISVFPCVQANMHNLTTAKFGSV